MGKPICQCFDIIACSLQPSHVALPERYPPPSCDSYLLRCTYWRASVVSVA